LLVRRALLLTVLVTAFAGRVEYARAQGIPAGPGGSLSSSTGLALDVPVVVDMSQRPERLGSFALRLQWSPVVLRFDAAIPGSFGAATISLDSAPQGVVRVSGANPAGVDGVVTLGIGRFTPLTADTTTLRLTISELYAAGSFASLLPHLVITNRQYCPASGRYGDINDDGVANSADALLAVTHAVGLGVGSVDIGLGDVDGDGVTNTRDALAILSHAVGLPTPGFRILQFVPGGGCSESPASTIAVLPATSGDILPGQTIRYEARFDANGQPQTGVGLRWYSSNTGVASVDSVGRSETLAPGSTQIWVVRNNTDSASATLTVVARRTRHFVDATAANATNHLGTVTLPFHRVGDAIELATAGDTIQLRPGRYDEALVVDRTLTFLGDTLANGTWPRLALSGAGTEGALLQVADTGVFTARTIEFADAGVAILVTSARGLDLDNVRSENVAAGIYLSGALGQVSIRNSRLLGSRLSGVYGSGIESDYYYGAVDTLLVEDTEIGDFTAYGIYVGTYAQMTLRRANLHDVGYGLLLAGLSSSPQDVGHNVLIENSRFRNEDNGIALYGFQTFTMRDSRIDGIYDEALALNYGRSIVLRRDSINVLFDDWIAAYLVDSLQADSLTVNLGEYGGGYLYNVPRVRVLDSRFESIGDDALDVYYGGGGSGDSVIVRRSHFIGRSSYDGYGLYVQNAHVLVDSSSFRDLYRGVQAYDSTLTVVRSSFDGMRYGVEYGGNYLERNGRMEVRNSVFSDTDYPVEGWEGAMVVDSNTITRGYQAIEFSGPYPVSITRNRITGAYEAIGLYTYDSVMTVTITDNVIRNVTRGVYLSGAWNSHTRLEVRRDSITCVPSEYGEGITWYYASLEATDNDFSGCRQALNGYNSVDTLRVDSILRNRITMPRNAYGGIRFEGNSRVTVAGNTITGDTTGTTFGPAVWLSRYYGCSVATNCRPMFRVDSNLIELATGGIVLEGGDSASVIGNVVRDVSTAQFDEIRGGISIYGGGFYSNYPGPVRVYGNLLERIGTYGIGVLNVDTGLVTVDSNRIRQSPMGLRLRTGRTLTTRNRITGSSIAAVYLTGDAGTAHGITQNNFAGNRYGVSTEGVAIGAANNWWGDALGPRCLSGCDPGSAGDSVSSLVSFTPFLTAEAGATPPLAPPPALAMPVVTTQLVAAAAGSADIARPRPAEAPRRQSPAPRPARTAVRRPAGLPDAVTASRDAQARVAQERSAAVERRQTARSTARETLRAELERRREALRAQRDSARDRRGGR
jgi:nitrous oxidase accessory protein NosD